MGAPYLEALDIPLGIMKALREVLLQFPHDYITDDDALHAFFLWYDINMDAEMKQERSIGQVRKGARSS
jgi:hypothetical protein